MKTVTFDILSVLKFKLDMIRYERISSKVGWVQKGIDLTEKRFPRLIGYLSKQSIMANLDKYRIVIESDKMRKPSLVRKVFSIWIRKERGKRVVFVILEALLVPFTGILAVLPGPNFFFYIPALFLYYHWRSLKGLKRLDLENLELEIVFTGGPADESEEKGGDRI